MVAPRSAPALSGWLAPVVVALGVVAMGWVGPRVAGLGLRPALVLSELALALPALGVLALARVPLGAGLALAAPSRRTTFAALAAGVAFWVLSLGLFELQYAVWPPPEGLLEVFRQLHRALAPSGLLDALVSVFAIALAPAACEEALFRGVVLPAFVRRLGAAGAVGVSAALFGLIHVDAAQQALSLYRVPFAFVIGVGLGALRLRTGSLVAPFLAHGLLNTLTFVAVPLTDAASPYEVLPDPQPWLGAALLLAGAAGGAFALRAVRSVDSPGGAA